MGMHLYEKTVNENGTTTLKFLQSVRISGAEGIVAKFIKSNPDEDLENWALSPYDIATLIGLEGENKAIIFTTQYESSGEPSISLLKTLTGKSNIMETEVLFMLQPVENAKLTEGKTNTPFEVELPEKLQSENVFESVLVKGGISNLKHSWKLAPPKMQIGGVIR